MSSVLFPKAASFFMGDSMTFTPSLLSGVGSKWLLNPIYAHLIDDDYSYTVGDAYSDISPFFQESILLTGKTSVDGVLGCDLIEFSTDSDGSCGVLISCKLSIPLSITVYHELAMVLFDVSEFGAITLEPSPTLGVFKTMPAVDEARWTQVHIAACSQSDPAVPFATPVPLETPTVVSNTIDGFIEWQYDVTTVSGWATAVEHAALYFDAVPSGVLADFALADPPADGTTAAVSSVGDVFFKMAIPTGEVS